MSHAASSCGAGLGRTSRRHIGGRVAASAFLVLSQSVGSKQQSNTSLSCSPSIAPQRPIASRNHIQLYGMSYRALFNEEEDCPGGPHVSNGVRGKRHALGDAITLGVKPADNVPT
jgi:hypothetical protein